MLSWGDEALVLRDREIPGLALLLDDEILSEILAAAWSRDDLSFCGERYTRYKPGASCLVQRRVRVGDRSLLVHASAWDKSAGLRLAKARTRVSVGSDDLPGRVEDPARGLLFSLFPNDRRVRALRRLADAKGRARLVKEFAGCEADNLDVDLLAYKAERRFVGRIRGDGRILGTLRLYTEGGYDAAVRTLRPHGCFDVLRLPRLLGVSPKRRAFGYEWLPGIPLSDDLRANRISVGELERCGYALAEFHAMPAVTRLPGLDLKERLATAVHAVSWLLPSEARRAGELAERIAGQLASSRPTGPIHGDFYDRQVILSSRGIGFIDFDQVRLGRPAEDIGLFAAHLEMGQLLNGNRAPAAVEVLPHLLAGYAGRASVPRASEIRAWTALGLLLTATRAFRRGHSDWPGHVAACVSRALTLSESGSACAPCRTLDPWGVSHDAALSAGNDLGAQAVERALATRHKEPRVVKARVVRHRMGRRAVVRYDTQDADGRPDAVFGKLHRRGPDLRTDTLQRQLWERWSGDPTIGVAEPLGVVAERGMTLQRAVPGLPAETILFDRRQPSRAQSAAGRIGAALRRFHAEATCGDRCQTLDSTFDELRAQLSLADGRRELPPERVRELVDALWVLAPSYGSLPHATLHRDFHPGQILLDGERVILLDLDQFRAGDPAIDLGNFTAHLIEWGLRRFGSPGLFASVCSGFERGYGVDPKTKSRARFHECLTLLRHVGISQRIPGRESVAPQLLKLCDEKLASLRENA